MTTRKKSKSAPRRSRVLRTPPAPPRDPLRQARLAEIASTGRRVVTEAIVDYYFEEAKAVAKAKLHLMLFPESK